jgi:hypothetical protein
MIGLLIFLLRLLLLPFKPKLLLEAENAVLRQQVSILQRKLRGRVQLTNGNRLFFLQLYRWFPSILKAMTIVQPDTLLRWHREGVRRYRRWKSRNLGGRPAISGELRALIRRMSLENPLWGAPHIHGELLKLGFVVAQSTVAKYMAQKGGDPSGQSWGTFLRNHAPHIAAMDCARQTRSRAYSRRSVIAPCGQRALSRRRPPNSWCSNLSTPPRKHGGD